MDLGSFPHEVTRMVFDTGQPYKEFRARPSTEFASFASRPIAQVGVELERKLAALLGALDVETHEALDHAT
jgi:hypothetical protein